MSGIVTAWHGTPRDHDVLDVAKAIAEQGYAQHGDGLYLTSSLADALSYALPKGYIWRCEIDIDIEGLMRVALGDDIVHHIVTNQAAIIAATRHAVVQDPPRKLNHRDRRMAEVDPSAFGITLIPDIPASARWRAI